MASDTSREIERLGVHAADPVPDPGLPHHIDRVTDTDPVAAKRAERQVAAMFGLAAILVLVASVGVIVLPIDTLAEVQRSNLVIGIGLGGALFLIGAGAIHWAKKLMPDVEIVEQRKKHGDPAITAGARGAWDIGLEESGFTQRPLVRRSLLGALLLLPIPAVVLLRDLGPFPGDYHERTIWDEGVRVLNDYTFTPVRASDLEIGQLVNAMPATYEEIPHEEHAERLAARAMSALILVRMEPEEIVPFPGRENWDVDGILAYSKICTHTGCPISLYEQQTHNLLCPCHQSTFNLADHGRVIFGPANRPLPQLALAVDDEGYLVAQGDFTESVGPSYWERG